jgi:hypothetical protein
VRQVERHVESDNLILLTVLLEIKQVIALIAVDNKQLISAYNSPFYMLIKVLQLLQAKLIYYLAILRDCNYLVM